MPFLRTNRPATLEERLAATAATKAAALSVFHAAADDLEAAADEAHGLRDIANAEIERLQRLESAAHAEACEATTKAALIRDAFLG